MIKDVIYKCIGDDFQQGVVACGFMEKNKDGSQEDFIIGYYSCFFVLYGNGIYLDDKGNSYEIKKNSFVQRLPGQVHSTIINNTEPWLEFFVSCGKNVFEYLSGLGLLPIEPVIYEAGGDLTKEIFQDILNKTQRASNEDLPFILIELQKLILQMSASVKTSSPIKLASDILNSNYDKEIDLIDLSTNLNISYETFRKAFVKEYNISPSKYRCLKRMEYAKLLLSAGNPIKEVAILVGYGDSYAFTKQFTKVVGIAPGKYIKEMQKGLL